MEPRARVSVWPGRRRVPGIVAPTLGEHVEQNVSLATSSDARLRRPVRVTVLRCADVCAMEPDPAPRKHAPPQAVYPRRLMGVWGFYRATWSIPGRIFGAEGPQFTPLDCARVLPPIPRRPEECD